MSTCQTLEICLIFYCTRLQPLYCFEKPIRRRRHLQLPPFNPQRDFKASDLEIRRDLQHICQCTSTEAGQLLNKDKTLPVVSERRRKPRETKEVKAVLGLASYIWEGERGLLTHPDLTVDPSVPTRKRRNRNSVKQTEKRMKPASTSNLPKTMTSQEVQTSPDLFPFRETESPLFAQRLNLIMSYLNLPVTSVIQIVRNHALDQNAMRRDGNQGSSRLSRAATHVIIARRLKLDFHI